MKYLFKGLAWILTNLFLWIFWFLISGLLLLWHFNFKNIQSPKEFWISTGKELENEDMLRWTIVFLVIAILSAIFGFGGITPGAAGLAKVLFFIFLVLFVLSLIASKLTTDI